MQRAHLGNAELPRGYQLRDVIGDNTSKLFGDLIIKNFDCSLEVTQ